MNKKQTLSIILLCLLGVSCVKEAPMTDDTKNNPFGKYELHCEIEANLPNTKTALLADSTTVVWGPQEQMLLFSAEGNRDTLSMVSGYGTSSASFAGNLTGSVPYTAFYPASGGVHLGEEALFFHLPETQIYYPDTFGPKASPMVASVENIDAPVQFKNLCGLLCLRLSAKPSFRVSKLVIKDLAGKELWGDCRLELDGTQGTSAQTMKITGGSDEITLVMPAPVTLPETSPIRFYVVLPPNSLSDGFSVSIYDDAGERATKMKTLNPAARVDRAMITNMSKADIRTESVNPLKRGYYKDLYMDGGINLTNRRYLPAAEYIGWDYEYVSPSSRRNPTQNDEDLQRSVFISADDDENGYLLYPDRQPRYRCIYVVGGDSKRHGTALGETGRKTVYDFVYNGGSYVGTCAGAFLACKGVDSYKDYPNYFQIFPGHMYHTATEHDYPEMIMPGDSPLRNYYSFGESIKHIMHSGGGFMSEKPEHMVEGTEILLRYGNWPTGPTTDEGTVGCWAYKPGKETGRMVLIGSHPEYGTAGDQRNLFAAILQYASDGRGVIPIKANLSNGIRYHCESLSSENNPAHARIGDKQYHHFTIDIPAGARNLVIDLKSSFTEDDLYLSLHNGDYAWFSEADYVLDNDGSNKMLKVRNPKAGKWFVSVYAPNTVTTELTRYDTSGLYYKYVANTHLLNGIPYSIKVDWEE